jgi:hypothetical protein
MGPVKGLLFYPFNKILLLLPNLICLIYTLLVKTIETYKTRLCGCLTYLTLNQNSPLPLKP